MNEKFCFITLTMNYIIVIFKSQFVVYIHCILKYDPDWRVKIPVMGFFLINNLYM